MEMSYLPMIAMRGIVIFPEMVLHFDLGRDKSVNALELAVEKNTPIFLAAQKDMRVEEPEEDDIYEIGVISNIKQVLKLPGDNMRILASGVTRARMLRYVDADDVRYAEVEVIPEPEKGDPVKAEAQVRSMLSLFEKYARSSNKLSPDVMLIANEIKNPAALADLLAGNVLVRIEDKQRVLDALDTETRVNALVEALGRETEIAGIESEIARSVKKHMEQNQKEYYLREQIKVIQKELDGDLSEAEALMERIEAAPLSDEAREKAVKEVHRLERMSSGSPEGSVIATYVDWIVSLPWGVETEDNMDLKNAQRVLDNDHYGLTKVKERVIEYLAVRKMKNDMKGPILCFVGPPGVGKTSVARSIASAIGRNFVRTSLGGVRDESEIRGHRRTYVGAIPGRIISSMKQAGSMNPVFLFDEIDKMSSDFRGDPASAMLEVLDPEINSTFRDHYMDMGFDLSKVMFLTTANTVDTIPKPLLDRMEVIELTSYMENEKLQIARRHLLPKQMKEHGLKRGMLKVSEGAMKKLINNYTAEAGVRNLERALATVCRKAARQILEDDIEQVNVTGWNLERFMGPAVYHDDRDSKKPRVGVVMGLAWTSVGGKTLPVETVVMEGKGEITLTGQLGDVMQESARAAIGYIRANCQALGVECGFHENKDVHIHCPAGAVPKDGPSAGITMATAVLSALTGKPVRADVAMTGEITLTGRVLPIGGLKEKVLAAQRHGIKTVVIPKENARDLSEIPEEVTSKLTFVMAEDVMTVFKTAIMD